MTHTNPLRRRSFLLAGGGVAAGLAIGLPGLAAADPDTDPGRDENAGENVEAALYYRLLLLHTRWAETLWDEATGHYPSQDFYFLNVLGNAVLVSQGDYDADLAGVERDVLADHTIRTIRHFAATNFWATGSTWGDGGYEWGGRIFWDGTFESYFVAAARLLWDRLDQSTRDNVDAIAIGGAEYVVGLGTAEDPRSGGWSSNGLAGGYRGDSKIEEMGAKSMPIATGLAHHGDHPNAGAWREWLTRWLSNMTGLPSADRNNHTLLEGRPVSEWNTAQNLYEGHVVENHESYAPMYQQSTGAYPGRNAVHFLIAGQPLPDVFTHQPNAEGLWRTLTALGNRAGLSSHPMVNDRYHLYGRDVLPLTWRRMGQADPVVARSERMLIEHLEPYLAHPPENRLTKFSGEPKYEPEARAEVAMAYLLHLWRDRLHGDVHPVSEARYWAEVAGVTDYGADLGMVGHQSAAALAIAVTKANYVKFAFVPEHDDWLFDVTGRAPAFLPSTTLAVTGRTVTTYDQDTDGFAASATTLRFAGGFAGFATLPTGAVVYATTGLAAEEGALRLHSLDMPGVPGLDGDRVFHGEGGAVTLRADGGDGGVDEVAFPGPVTGRYVRMLGGRSGSQYGYSLWRFEVFGPGSDTDLARGRPTTASSFDPAFPPELATDGDPATRWAVARAQRPRPDSWLAVDLGAEHELDRALLSWDPAFGAEYRVQVSSDGVTWRDAVSVPSAHTFAGGWVNVEDRAGFVVRGGENPIRVTGTSVTLSAGAPAPVVVAGYPAQRAARTRELAGAPAPSADVPGVAAALADDHLAVFNLTGAAVTAAVRVPGRRLFPGTQAIAADHTVRIGLDAASSAVLPAVFELSTRGGGPVRLTATVAGRESVELTNEGRRVAVVVLRRLDDGRERTVPVRPGTREVVRFGR
ncbi:discoidin domain-containing protein [Actinophytocola xinjiangensis]|uniref:discoidin domain-containing protein n=1 Tax=Actinophytocola xinjiangensis TaxID=485602 RepID=UPI000A070D2E|nr:discoidin domain-containing protein [Actinophytocola xinjiangensis]